MRVKRQVGGSVWVVAVSASQRALAVRGKERERGEMIKRIEGCNARLERGPDHLWSEISVWFSTSTHAQCQILSTAWIAHLLL